MTTPLVVNCPTCQQSVAWGPQNPYRPFCCQRCQWIDLDAWATEKRVITDQAEPTPSPALPVGDPAD